MSLNAFPQFPDCMCCSDTGIQHLPDYPPCYRFCGCAAGIQRRKDDPFEMEQFNALESRMRL